MQILFITSLLLLLAVWLTFADWRRAILVAIPIGILQDPLRKLAPGEPVYYVMLVGVVVAAGVLAAAVSRVPLMPNRIWGWRRYLAVPFGFFVGIIAIQALNSYLRFGNPILPAIGALTYLVPFVAMALFYQTFVRSPERYPLNFIRLYVLSVSLALTTVALEYYGFNWPIFGEVGPGIALFDQGTKMSVHSGLFRSSEIAAWHVAAVVCLLIALIVSEERITLGKALWIGGFVLLIIGIGVLTGRRKFMMQIAIFGSVYITLLSYFGRGAIRVALISGAVGLLGFLAFIFVLPEEKHDRRDWRTTMLEKPYDLYVERTKNVFGDVPDRFVGLGLAPITWAYNRFGIMGAGLGVGSQGVQHFGVRGMGAAEGGLGKIWLELGGIGFVIAAWLGWSLLRHLSKIMHLMKRQSAALSRLTYGLASFLVANLATFAVATQAYGDIFVLTIIGSALALLLAMPILAEKTMQKRFVSAHNAPQRTLGHSSGPIASTRGH